MRHFQQLIDKRKILSGGYVADPFVVAKAMVQNRIVLTREKFKENAAKIPNVCKHFGAPCVDIEEFNGARKLGVLVGQALPQASCGMAIATANAEDWPATPTHCSSPPLSWSV